MNDHVGSGWITPLFQAVFSGLLFGLAGFCSSWPIVELDRAALWRGWRWLIGGDQTRSQLNSE